MDKWEYATLVIKPNELLEELTKFGLEGWERASIIAPDPFPVFYNLVFKRKLREWE